MLDAMDQLRINVVSIDNDSGQVISSSTLPFLNGYDVNLAALDNDKVLIQHKCLGVGRTGWIVRTISIMVFIIPVMALTLL